MTDPSRKHWVIRGSPGPTEVWYAEYTDIAAAAVDAGMWMTCGDMHTNGRTRTEICICVRPQVLRK